MTAGDRAAALAAVHRHRDAAARALDVGGPAARRLLAGLRAAALLADPLATTRAEVVLAQNALLARALARRLHALGQATIAAPLEHAAAALLADAGSWRLPPGALEAWAALLEPRFDDPGTQDLVDALCRGDAARHDVEADCRPGGPPLRLAAGVPGRRLRVLAAALHASPYAPTAQLVALPSARPVGALDAGSEPVLRWPWRAAGWAETGPGEGLGLLHTGRIPSHYSGSLEFAAV